MPKIGAVICGGIPHVKYAKRLGMHSDRIFTGYNSVDNAFWSTMASGAQAKADEFSTIHGLAERRYFIAVGRFIEKNFEALIEQYANYRRESQGRALDISYSWGRELRPQLERKIKELELLDEVKLPGYLSSETLAPYLGLAGAFILPSAGYE